MAKAVRTTITVPGDLKARMDAVTEDVNWSAVASRAFEQKLAEIIERKGVKNMEDVIARLRVSKAMLVSEHFKLGYDTGSQWAKENASAEELIRLFAWYEGIEDLDYFFGEPDNRSAYGASELLYFAINPDLDGSRSDAREFWESVAGEDETLSDDGVFVRGFAEGACDVWREVKDKL